MATRGTQIVMVAIAGVALAAIAVVVGLRAPNVDVDQAVYERTVQEMRAGSGYYDAMRTALVGKDGVGPSQVRSYRPPLLFLVWRLLPVGSLRYLAGIMFFAAILGAAVLSGSRKAFVVFGAAALAGVWMVHFSPYLYLHAEVWAGALIVWGLAVLRTRPDLAAVLLALATACREIALVAFIVAAVMVVLDRRSWRPWVWATGSLVVYYGVHVWLASSRLDPLGYEPPFDGVLANAGLFTFELSPGDSLVGYAVGFSGLALAVLVTVVAFRHDIAARTAAVVLPVLVLLTLWSGRVYWQALWALLVAGFAPEGIDRGLAWWRARRALAVDAVG